MRKARHGIFVNLRPWPGSRTWKIVKVLAGQVSANDKVVPLPAAEESVPADKLSDDELRAKRIATKSAIP